MFASMKYAHNRHEQHDHTVQTLTKIFDTVVNTVVAIQIISLIVSGLFNDNT